jgi:hypothetical protein
MAGGPMVTARQTAFTPSKGLARGDMVLVAGFRVHGFLIAKLVLFAPPATKTVTPTATPTAPASATPTSSAAFSGNNS